MADKYIRFLGRSPSAKLRGERKMDLEKVIKGLECCLSGPMQCEVCPYKTDDDTSIPHCVRDLRENAISLLKAQEARVMTLEEVSALEDGDFVWIEINGGIIYCLEAIAVIKNFDGSVSDIQFNTPTAFVELSAGRINKRWRCWTSRPTDAQREATQWAK